MSEKYYQEYGPIRRRRAHGQIPSEPPRKRIPEPELPPDPSRRGRRRFSLLSLLLVALIATGGYLALPYGANALAAGNVLKGVTLQGQPIGGLAERGVRAGFQEPYNSFLRAP
ncbi:MAG TPA: vanomycin resistance protein VanB, partial [Roseiflexaceae bacterium]|nr:vanomycin resistance protein VanB [Roseiflexaceae bacterium]